MLKAKSEPRNPVDKPHLLNERKPDSWLFNQKVESLQKSFFFLFLGTIGVHVIIKRKPVSLGGGEEMQVL